MNQLLRAALVFLLFLPALSYSAETPAGTARELIGLHLRPEIAQYLSDKIARYPTEGGRVGNLAIGPTAYLNGARATEDFSLGTPPVNISAATSGTENTYIGIEAGREATYGSDNTCLGARACRDQTTPYYNTGIGHYALGFNVTGWKNVAVGAFAMNGAQGETDAHENVGVGFRSMELIEDGQYNVGLGSHTLLKLIDGVRNSALGADALQQVTGSGNTAAGQASLANLTTGENNVAVGLYTGQGITTGSGNTILGAQIDELATGLTNNILIGNGTGAVKAQHNGTDWTLTGNVSTTGPWIPPTLADGSAPNNSVYYSSTGSKLSYKDAGGTVHALH